MEGGSHDNDVAQVWDPEGPSTTVMPEWWLLRGALEERQEPCEEAEAGFLPDGPGERREMYACVSLCWGQRVSGSQRSYSEGKVLPREAKLWGLLGPWCTWPRENVHGPRRTLTTFFVHYISM